MDKKGMTLKYLLSIIVIVGAVGYGIYYLIKLNKRTNENNFITNSQTILRLAKETYVSNSLLTKENACFDSETNPLKLGLSDDIHYYIHLNNDGNITDVIIYNKLFEITVDDSVVTEHDIGSQYSDKKYKSKDKEVEIVLPKCDN